MKCLGCKYMEVLSHLFHSGHLVNYYWCKKYGKHCEIAIKKCELDDVER